MPYISKERRRVIDWCDAVNAGELNFVFTKILIEYWKTHTNYQGINDIVGSLEGAKLEFYRRIAIPYETTKIAENGDCY